MMTFLLKNNLDPSTQLHPAERAQKLQKYEKSLQDLRDTDDINFNFNMVHTEIFREKDE